MIKQKRPKSLPINLKKITITPRFQLKLIEKIPKKDFILNKKCDNQNACIKCIGKNVIVIKKIGSGTFGTLYHIKQNGNSRAVKVIKIKTLRDLVSFSQEIKMSSYMGKIGLGPKIYNAIYTENDDNTFTQYLSMEKFDGDLFDFYYKPSNNKQLRSITRQMLQLIDRKTFSDITCLDIKPANFVFKYTKNRVVVKMIDFGTDWCVYNNNKLNYMEKIVINIFLKMQMLFLIYDTRKLTSLQKKIITKEYKKNLFKTRFITKIYPLYDGGILPPICPTNNTLKHCINTKQLVDNITLLYKKVDRLSPITNWYFFKKNSNTPLTKEKWTELFKNFFDKLT